MILTARIYEPPPPEDGYRLHVMRFWPRGVRKEAVDGWERELAPSAELLRAYRAGRVEWAEALEGARLDQEVGAVIVPAAVQPLQPPSARC